MCNFYLGVAARTTVWADPSKTIQTNKQTNKQTKKKQQQQQNKTKQNKNNQTYKHQQQKHNNTKQSLFYQNTANHTAGAPAEVSIINM